MIDLNDFENADFQQWEEKVINDLGLSSIDELNSIMLTEKIGQPPFVDFTTAPANDLITSYRHCQTHKGEEWQGARHWLNMEMIDSQIDAEVNQLAITALMGGADGVIVSINEQSDWNQLLSEISLPDCFIGVTGSVNSFIKLKSHLDKHGLAMKGFARLSDLDYHVQQPKLLAPMILESQPPRMLVLKASESSAGGLDELAELLSHVVWLAQQLTEQGVPLKAIFLSVQLSLELSNSYLWEICRLRCLRILFHQIVIQYGITDIPPKSLSIHALTKISEADHSSLISNIGQALAGVLGGCDVLSVTAESGDTASENTRNKRIARNVSHILKHECYLDKVSDPVAGSYYLEDLTQRMLREVWSRFQAIEQSGGYMVKAQEL